nr:predicted GPI-anchored protein 58 isoform X2 [Manis javanica]XP_036848614.1 predicted GPI-anchored protein 58 isoform X2 [Manis javanica]
MEELIVELRLFLELLDHEYLTSSVREKKAAITDMLLRMQPPKGFEVKDHAQKLETPNSLPAPPQMPLPEIPQPWLPPDSGPPPLPTSSLPEGYYEEAVPLSPGKAPEYITSRRPDHAPAELPTPSPGLSVDKGDAPAGAGDTEGPVAAPGCKEASDVCEPQPCPARNPSLQSVLAATCLPPSGLLTTPSGGHPESSRKGDLGRCHSSLAKLMQYKNHHRLSCFNLASMHTSFNYIQFPNKDKGRVTVQQNRIQPSPI